MSARAKQSLKVIKNKNPRNPGSYILISAKTGYINVTINGTQYYYNKKATSTNGKAPTLKSVLASTSNSKKKVIVVRKR